MTNLIFDESEVFDIDSAACKERMSDCGGILKSNNVRHILLVHGTFVGDDPLDLLNWLEQIERNLLEPIEKNLLEPINWLEQIEKNLLEPMEKSLLEPIKKKLMSSPASIINLLRSQQKSLIDHLAKDLGNYTLEYANALSNALNHEITCQRFIWSSGNFHLARLKGTVELAQKLANIITENKILESGRILLLGHSHAGQLFALLTTFLEDGAKAKQLYGIIKQNDRLGKIHEILSNLETIKTVNLDIVTFGTPVRYSWGEHTKYRLMAIVNHRSSVDISGLLSTRDGDYVQQWGAEGTDVPPNHDEIALNDQLDAILDKGIDISLLINSLGHTDRKQPHYANGNSVSKPFSETFLVDYKDNASSLLEHLDITHCIKTLFGHGVYTEMRAMLFNTDIIVKNFYKSPG